MEILDNDENHEIIDYFREITKDKIVSWEVNKSLNIESTK